MQLLDIIRVVYPGVCTQLCHPSCHCSQCCAVVLQSKDSYFHNIFRAAEIND